MNFWDEKETKLRPSLLEVESELNNVKRFSWVFSIGLSALLLFFWPALNTLFDVFSFTSYKIWLLIGQVAMVISFFYFLIGPLIDSHREKIVRLFKCQQLKNKIPSLNENKVTIINA